MTARLACSLALALLVLAVAGCGEKSEPDADAGAGRAQRFTVVLDYFPNADHAPIYAAQASGEFRRAGLDVRIVTPPDPSAPLKLLQAGRADLAISYPPELLLARDKGTAVLSVGALVQEPLTSLMAIEGSGVRGVGDLRGKTVGTAGLAYQAAYLETILRAAGIPVGDVRRVDVGFNLVPAMISKRVDATLGAFWNYEGVDLRRRGRRPTILRMERLGVPTYPELVFAARRESLRPAQAARIRRFLFAVARGAVAVREDPDAAVDALLEANGELERGLQLAVVQTTASAFLPADAELPFGWHHADDWHAYGRWMLEQELVARDPRGEDAFTNEFLPGQGLAENTAEP